MNSGSDTEPESDDGAPERWDPNTFATQVAFYSKASTEGGDCVETVDRCIQLLLALNPSTINTDSTLHDLIQQSSSRVIAALESITMKECCSGSFPVLIAILRPAVITHLFALRKAFRRIAVQSLLQATSSSVITWVDVVLVRLSEAIKWVTAGPSVDPTASVLRSIRDDDNLRACTQIPERWSAVPGALSSRYSSPALSRMIVRILYGIFIIGTEQDRTTEQDKTTTGIDYFKFLGSSLREHILQLELCTDDKSMSPLDSIQQARLHYAMMLCLLARSEVDIDQSHLNSDIRPHTLESYMLLIKEVMHHKTTIIPSEQLDAAQMILISSPTFVPWCWSQWSDARFAGIETLVHLTINWLHQLSILEENSSVADSQSILNDIISEHHHIIFAFLQVLQRIIATLKLTSERIDNASLLGIVKQCCWILGPSLSPSDPIGILDDNQVEIGHYLCAIFAFLKSGFKELEVKETIIGTLSLLTANSLKIAFQNVSMDPHFPLIMRIEEDVNSLNTLISDDSYALFASIHNLRQALSLLQFVTLLWAAEVGDQLIVPSSTLLAALVKLLFNHRRIHINHDFLTDAVIVAIANIERRVLLLGIDNFHLAWNPLQIWMLGSNQREGDLAWAAGYAGYIIVTSSTRQCDDAAFARAWCYLSDVLVLIVTGYFDGDDQPLSLLILPSLFLALKALIQEMPSEAAHFIRRSPWTSTLVTTIREATNLQMRNGMMELVSDQLSQLAPQLLEAIFSLLRHDTRNSALQSPSTTNEHKTRDQWVFYGSPPVGRLVPIKFLGDAGQSAAGSLSQRFEHDGTPSDRASPHGICREVGSGSF